MRNFLNPFFSDFWS